MAWIRAHKGPAAAVGAAGGLGLLLLYEHGKKASTAAGTTATAPGPSVFSGQTDPSYGALEAQILALQNQISNLTKGRRKKPPPPPPHRKPRPPRRRKEPGTGGPPTVGPPKRRHPRPPRKTTR